MKPWRWAHKHLEMKIQADQFFLTLIVFELIKGSVSHRDHDCGSVEVITLTKHLHLKLLLREKTCWIWFLEGRSRSLGAREMVSFYILCQRWIRISKTAVEHTCAALGEALSGLRLSFFIWYKLLTSNCWNQMLQSIVTFYYSPFKSLKKWLNIFYNRL